MFSEQCNQSNNLSWVDIGFDHNRSVGKVQIKFTKLKEESIVTKYFDTQKLKSS